MIRRSNLLATASLLVAVPLHAQQFSLRLGGLRTQYADTLNAGAGSIAAQAAWAGTRAQGVLEASWSQFDTGNGAAQLWGSFAAMGPRTRHAGLGLRADGVTNAIAGSSWSGTSSAELFGALAARGWTLTLGLSAGGVRSINTARFATAGAALRTWYERGAWSVGAAVAATTSKDFTFTDVSTSADYRHGRFTLGGIAATRHGDLGERPWYQAHASVRLSPVVSLETALGSYPQDLAGYNRGRYASVGMRLRLNPLRTVTSLDDADLYIGADRPVIERLDSNRTRLTFTLAEVSAPAIVGSWNDWTPAPMASAGAGRWSVILPIGAGTFRFALVLESGRWIVPDGVTRLPDDFDGDVGILVVLR